MNILLFLHKKKEKTKTLGMKINFPSRFRCTPLTNDVELECERQARFGYILPPVTSAYLTTRNKFSFVYGKVEARVRGPVGDWLYGRECFNF